MKRSLASLMAVGLCAGLLSVSAPATGSVLRARSSDGWAAAAPQKPSGQSLTVTFTAFKFASGTFTGKVEADRRLSLQDGKRNPRSVTITKTAGAAVKTLTATLNLNKWSSTETATFSVKHPGMSISKRKARIKSLNGTYQVKLEAMTKQEYSKTFTTAGATKSLTVKV